MIWRGKCIWMNEMRSSWDTWYKFIVIKIGFHFILIVIKMRSTSPLIWVKRTVFSVLYKFTKDYLTPKRIGIWRASWSLRWFSLLLSAYSRVTLINFLGIWDVSVQDLGLWLHYSVCLNYLEIVNISIIFILLIGCY